MLWLHYTSKPGPPFQCTQPISQGQSFSSWFLYPSYFVYLVLVRHSFLSSCNHFRAIFCPARRRALIETGLLIHVFLANRKAEKREIGERENGRKSFYRVGNKQEKTNNDSFLFREAKDAQERKRKKINWKKREEGRWKFIFSWCDRRQRLAVACSDELTRVVRVRRSRENDHV